MSQVTIASLEADIKKRKQELAEAMAALEKAKLESPDQQLARELHGILCTWNHTDGCGWFYEMKNKEDDWTGRTHGEYLRKAGLFRHACEMRNISVEQAFDIYKLVKGV